MRAPSNTGWRVYLPGANLHDSNSSPASTFCKMYSMFVVRERQQMGLFKNFQKPQLKHPVSLFEFLTQWLKLCVFAMINGTTTEDV